MSLTIGPVRSATGRPSAGSEALLIPSLYRKEN
jgi:hypothetical protein